MSRLSLAAAAAGLCTTLLISGCIIIEDEPPRRPTPPPEPPSTLATDPGRMFRCTTGKSVLDYKITDKDIGWSFANRFQWTPRHCNQGERPRGQGSIATVCAISPGRAWSMTTLVQPYGVSVAEEEINLVRRTIVGTSSYGNKPPSKRFGRCHEIDDRGRRIDDEDE